MLDAHRPATAVAAMLLAVAATTPSSASIIRSAQPFVGVTHWQYIQQLGDTTNPYAREVVVNILEIDTQAAGIRFKMQPGNGADPGEVTRTTTRSYINTARAQIGINVGFYDTASPYGGFHTDLIHLAASDGNIVSTAAGGEATFNISATNVPEVRSAGAAGSSVLNNGAAVYNAGGGNQRILNGGSISAPNDSYTNTLNPHTALGVNQARTKVFLATVDGRQNDYSEGMFTTELASIMKDFGAWNAVNLDGGGSTTMVMDDSNNGVQNARVINSPSDNATTTGPGSERVVANSLAVFATPLAGYVPLADVPRPGVTGVKTTFTSPIVLDALDGTKGRYASSLTFSGTTENVAASSTASTDTAIKHRGSSSLRLDITNTNATPSAMQLRFLSGGGTASNNVVNDQSMGTHGFVGVMLRMVPGADDLFVSIFIDDGTVASNGLERGSFFKVIADGQFHLYQWDLGNAAAWENFNAGDGDIDGPNAFIDSLFFSSTNATTGGPNFSGSVWMDTVIYNPNGPLNALVPEPTATIALAGALMITRRRRNPLEGVTP
jgi:hypothetical protein